MELGPGKSGCGLSRRGREAGAEADHLKLSGPAWRKFFLMTEQIFITPDAEWILGTISRHPTSALAEPVPGDQFIGSIGCWHCDSVHVHPCDEYVYVLNGTVETGGQECQPGTFWFTLLTQRMVLTKRLQMRSSSQCWTHGVFEPC